MRKYGVVAWWQISQGRNKKSDLPELIFASFIAGCLIATALLSPKTQHSVTPTPEPSVTRFRQTQDEFNYMDPFNAEQPGHVGDWLFQKPKSNTEIAGLVVGYMFSNLLNLDE